MDVAASPVPVGVRALKNNLSHYLERVRDGEQVVVTDRGRPIARLVGIEASTDRLADLIEAGLVQPARRSRQKLPKRVRSEGLVSDLVAQQRR
jgi:prevent-host-death family protein